MLALLEKFSRAIFSKRIIDEFVIQQPFPTIPIEIVGID